MQACIKLPTILIFVLAVDWNARLTDYQDRLDDKVSRIASQYERDATVKMYALIGKERAGTLKPHSLSLINIIFCRKKLMKKEL